MIGFSLCIEPVLQHLDFYDRIAAAAYCGFSAIEFWNPANKNLEKIERLASANKISIEICATHDHRINNLNADDCVKNIIYSMKVIRQLGCSKLLLMSGDRIGKNEAQRCLIIENLKKLADSAEKKNMMLCLEPLNSFIDHKGYYLDSSDVAFEIVRCVGSSRIKVLYDIYHMQVMEGNIISTIRRNSNWIGYFHAAGTPGRNEPSSGELNMGVILNAIENTGYSGRIGLEYWPVVDSEASISLELKKLQKMVR
ncbi:MAG: TIM barrel protein [Saccharofermentanales bacterium]|jgi:hydroxypyruvate isomerase